MRQFQDTKGRVWDVEVNVGTITKTRIALDGVILPSLFDNGLKPFVEFVKDYEKLVTAIWCTCVNKHDDVDPAEFALSMGGDALGNATEALARSIADFFTSQEQRDSFHATLDSLFRADKEVKRMARDRVTEILAKAEPSLAAANFLNSVSSGQASHVSIPAHEPLVNST